MQRASIQMVGTELVILIGRKAAAGLGVTVLRIPLQVIWWDGCGLPQT